MNPVRLTSVSVNTDATAYQSASRHVSNTLRGADADVTLAPQGERLLTLASQVARLCPDRRDPERFHMDKSEIVATLRRLAREAGNV